MSDSQGTGPEVTNETELQEEEREGVTEEQEVAGEEAMEAAQSVEGDGVSVDEGPETPAEPRALTWEERVEALADIDEETAAEDGLERIVNAIKIVDLKEPGSPQISELWGSALRLYPESAKQLWLALGSSIGFEVETWIDLAAQHQDVLGMLEGEEAESVREVLGWVLLFRCDQVEQGLEIVQSFAEKSEASAGIVESLDVASKGNWRKVEMKVEELKKAEGLEGAELKAAVALQMADLAQSQGAKDRAVEVLRRAQRSDSSNPRLRDALAARYRDAQKWNAYVDLLKGIVGDAQSDEDKLDYCYEMVRVYRDEMRLDAMVVKTYEAILEVDPTNEDAVESLVESYEKSRRWPDLVGLLVRQAEAETGHAKSAVYKRIALVYLEKLSRQVDAIKYFELVLESNDSDEETLEHLKGLYDRRREWAKLIEIHQKEIALLGDPSEQVERLKAVAEIAVKKLRKPEVATEIWQSVLDVDPENVEALDSLEQLYERSKDWANLAEVFERRAALSDDPEDEIQLWQKMGGIYSDRLKDAEQATRAWRKVLELDPENAKGKDCVRKLLIEQKAWDELEAFFVEQEASEDLVRVLETLSKSAEGVDEQTELLFRAARVWEGLEEPQRAVHDLEKVLELDADNARAAEWLLGYYQEASAYDKQVSMLEIRFKAEESTLNQVQLAVALSDLLEKRLDNPEGAYQWRFKVLELSHSALHVCDSLERVASVVGKQEEVVAAYAKIESELEDPEQVREVLFRRGRLLAEEVDRADEALRIFEGILENNPEDFKALGALEMIFEKTGRFDELVEVNERRMRLASTPEEEAEILLTGARIHEFQRGDKATAIQSYERVRELAPNEIRALQELHRLYAEEQEFEALANVLRAEIRVLTEQGVPELDKRELRFELGQLAQKELFDYEEALECYRLVLDIDLGHSGAREALEGLLEAEIEKGQVAALLEPVYEVLCEDENLVSVLKVRLDVERETAGRIGFLERIAALQLENLDLDREAFDSLFEALELGPEKIENRAKLAEIAESLDALELLKERIVKISAAIDERALRTDYCLYLAELGEGTLEDRDFACASGREALQFGGDQMEVLDKLEALFGRLESWSDLIDVLGQKSALVDDDKEAQLALRLKTAGVMEEKLGEREGAIEVYLGILDEEPSNFVALDALDRLYRELEQWDDAASNLGRRLDLLEEDAEREVVLCQLARVLYEHLEESERSVEIYRGVMERNPASEEALADLERMLESGDALTCELISEILYPFYEERDDWEKHVWINEMLIRVVEDPERKVKLLHDTAQNREARGQDFEGAFVAYSRAVRVQPDDEETLTQLYRFAEALMVWSELVDVLKDAASECEDGVVAKETLVRVAVIYREQLEDLEGATQAYEQAAEFDPEDRSILDSLEEIYRDAQSWESLAAVLVKKAAQEDELQSKKELLFQAAIIFEEMLQDIEQAIELNQEALLLDPEATTAVDSLERLYLATERWADLMSIFNHKIERAANADEQRELYYVVGALQERELQDDFGAIETYRKVLDIEPEDLQALGSLDKLYVKLEDWTNLLDILEREEEIASEQAEKLAFRYRQGETWHRKLNDLIRAVEVYRTVLEEENTYQEALDALEEIIEGGEFALDAAEVLEPIYKETAQWEKLIAVYEVMIREQSDRERRIELLSTIGMIREDMQGDADSAFATWIRVLKEDPVRPESWETLERISETYGLWELAVEKGKEVLAETEDIQDKIFVASQIAVIQEERLEADLDAIGMWRGVLELEPAEQRAILALDRLYERQQMWSELAEVLLQEIELTYEEEDILRLRYRLGTIYESFLGEVEEAIASFSEMLMIQPGNPEAIEALERMFEEGQGQQEIGRILEPFYRDTENWEKVVAVGLTLLEQLESSDERYQKLLDIADLYTGPIQDNANALFVYGRALVERPGDELAVVRLSELANETEGWAEAVDFMRLALEQSDDEITRLELFWRLAVALDQELADVEGAEEAYLSVLELNEEKLEAYQALDRLYTATGRWADLTEVLRKEILYSYADDERIALYLRLGEVLFEVLEQGEAAIEAYREAVAIDPAQPEALAALERIHTHRQEWEELYQVYARQAETAFEDTVRADIWGRMANLAADLLGRPQDAIELWYQVLDALGDNALALQSLEMLFHQDGRWADMADTVERQIAIAESGEEQLELYRKLGRLWQGPLENDERALEYWRSALNTHPEDYESLNAIKEIDEGLGDYEDLVEILRRIVALGTLEYEAQLAHYIQIGELLTQILIRPDEAIEAWLQVLQLDPAHLQALNALEQLFTDEMRWEETVDILDRKAEVIGETSEKITIRMQIAEIWEQQVGNDALAAGAYDVVLDLDPAHDEAFQRLEVLHNRTEGWQDLLGLYVTRAEVVEGEDRLNILRQAAEIAEQRLEQPEMAFVVLQTALAEHWRDRALASELERLADKTRNWSELVELYEGIIQSLNDPKEALVLHNVVARWYFHKLNDSDRSWQHFQFVLNLDPENLGALEELSEIYRRLENWQELVNIEIKLAELSVEAEEKIAHYTTVAQVWEERLANQEQAIVAFRQVLALEENELNALQQLERIFLARQQWTELVEVLEKQTLVLYEPDVVVGIRYRIGEIWENFLADEEKAIASYRQVLNVEETHKESLDALERLLTNLNRWEELLRALEMKLQCADSMQEQIELYAKMATVYEEEFSEVDNAVTCMQHITMIDPANIMAIETLERLYRENSRWPDLVDTLSTHISLTEVASEQIELYRSLGEVFRDHLGDFYRAIESYQNLLDLDPQDADALSAIADLYYESADWMSCIEMLDRLVAVVVDPARGVEIQHRIGKIFEANLSQPEQAEERYQISLDIDASFMPAIESLQALYETREDYNGVIRMLKQKAEYTRDLTEKADILCIIGQIYDAQLGDSINAVDYYEQTLALSPENIYATRPLAEKYVREQKWARAESLLAITLQKLGHSREVEDLYLLNFWMGLCCEELGQEEQALFYYRQSYEYNQNYLPTLRATGRMLYRAEDYERAYKMFQTVLVGYADQLDGPSLVELYFDSAKIRLHFGDKVQGQQLFERVLEVDPTHRPTLDAIIELQEEEERWEVVADFRTRRMEGISDPTDRFAEFVALADIYKTKLGQVEQAIAAYREALEVDPKSKFVLLKLLDIYRQNGFLEDTIEVLDRLCDMEDNQDRLAKYYYTMGIICRDELQQELKAVEYFNKALDANVNELVAFEAVDRILTSMRDWRALERSYRKMIKRVFDNDEGQFTDTKYLLWYGLGEIYRTRLMEWDNAIQAFLQASAAKPGDSKMHRILADLYIRIGGQDHMAINEFKTLIDMPLNPADPYASSNSVHERNAEFYHSLFKLYLKTKSFDKAWGVCNVMTYLRVASEDELQFNERYLGNSLVQANGRLTPERWKKLYHPDENLRIGNVFHIIQSYCRDLFAYDLKRTWQLKKRDELDINADFLFCKMYRYLAQVIGVVPAPKIYFKKDQALGMLNGNLDPAGFIVGADMMQGRGQRELAFVIARQLGLATSVHYMAGLRLPSDTLRTLLLGAIRAATFRQGENLEPALEPIVKAVLKMPPPVKIDLEKIMRPIVEGRVEVNTSKWLKAVDHTANRLGLLLCGDVKTAMTAIKNDAAPISKLTIPEKEAELLRYAISEEYFELRAALEVAIG